MIAIRRCYFFEGARRVLRVGSDEDYGSREAIDALTMGRGANDIEMDASYVPGSPSFIYTYIYMYISLSLFPRSGPLFSVFLSALPHRSAVVGPAPFSFPGSLGLGYLVSSGCLHCSCALWPARGIAFYCK